MMNFINRLKDIFSIEELKNKILLTIGLIAVYRFMAAVPLPGIDPLQLSALKESTSGGLLGLLNAFTGGAFARASVMALGIMPYISASIVVQLMGIAVPYLQKLQKDGESGRKKNTIDAYFTALKEIYHHFKILDKNELLETKEQDIINYIEETYKEKQTIKVKLCSIYKGYNILRIESLYLKNKIDEYRTKTTIETDKNKEANKKDESEGEEMINTFKNHLEELEGNIKEDTEILTKWKHEAQLYFVLKIYLNYGVLRPSEILKCLITDTDDNNDKINYINVKTKKIVINNHKNNDKRGAKEFVLDDKLIKGLKAGLGRYLITNEEGKVYESSSSFTKLFKKHFNYNPYDLRKAISSKAIAEGNTDRIKQLEYIQSHSLNVILQHYNKYSKKD